LKGKMIIFVKTNNMCSGIILKDGTHLQTVRQVEQHFKQDLKAYYIDPYDGDADMCTCQIDLERFMKNEHGDEYYYECGEYWETEK
jgi:hypothetical protein